MSARQVFIPRPQSSAPQSDSHQGSTDAGEQDGLFNGNGKPRSIAAFFGQKRGTRADTPLQPGSTPTLGLARANSSANRRSFDGIQRPEKPYPTTAQLAIGAKEGGTGQTPRKAVVPGAFDFTRPLTPASAPRALRKGFGISAESREDDGASSGNAHGVGFMSPVDEVDVRGSVGKGIGGYMRVFEGSGSCRSAGNVQLGPERNIAAPVPGYAHGGLGGNVEDEDYQGEDVFARSSRSLDAMMERNHDSQPHSGGTKRGINREDREEMEGRQQGPAKRMKQVQHDPREYAPILTPHISSISAQAPPAVNVSDPSLIASSLFEGIEEFVNLEEIRADWNRWRECANDEWLKGADKLAQEYTDILNMVKEHLTGKVMAYANMIKAVDERRTEVSRNIEIIQGKGSAVRENICKLGTKK